VTYLEFAFILTLQAHSYHVGVLSSVLVHPGFTAALGKPTAAQKGVVTAIYYLGTWLSYIFLSHPAADHFGRRYAALTGTATVAIGTAFEAGATAPGAYAMMIIGRIISGMGVAILSTSVPLYQRLVMRQVSHITVTNSVTARLRQQHNVGNTWS
jgi:MFS family permease